MTQIYQIRVKNKELKDAPALHFEKKETAEAVMGTFNALIKKGKKLEWECTVIDVLSHEEALEEFMMASDIFSGKSK